MLGYTPYRLLQNYVHLGHKRQKKLLLKELDGHYSYCSKSSGPAELEVAVLELGCGAGNLASIFPETSYYGIDCSVERIALARRDNHRYRFSVEDIRGAALSALVPKFSFIFCHGLLHHLNDDECRKLLRIIKSESRRPVTFVAIEPILPLFRRNPLGYFLAKIDNGKYVRSSSQWRNILGGELDHSEHLSFFPRWPIDAEAYTLKFPARPGKSGHCRS